MSSPTFIDWFNEANIMIQEFAYKVLSLTRQFIDSYGLPLNEVEFLLILSISTLTIALIFNKIRKSRTYIPKNKINKIQMQDLKEEGRKTFTKRQILKFYANPGTFEIASPSGEKTPLFSGKYALYPKKPVPSLDSSEERILDSFNWLFDENE